MLGNMNNARTDFHLYYFENLMNCQFDLDDCIILFVLTKE
mgnify:CR=1 FL=1